MAAGRLRISFAILVLAAIFLLAGGIGALRVYQFGAASTSEARFALSAPFFAGFLFVGFLGMLKAYKLAGKAECLYGFLVVGFCYFSIEILYQACGGF